MWTRPPSRHLTGSLLKQGSAYYATLQEAQRADQIVQAKVENCRKAIDLLSSPLMEIVASIPCSRNDTPEHEQLVSLIGQIRTLLADCESAQREQAQLVEEARAIAQTDDILPMLQQIAHRETNGSPLVETNLDQFEGLFTTQLVKYVPLQTKVDKAVNVYETHLAALRLVHERFSDLSNNYAVVQRRRKVIQNLEQVFVQFKEIRTNLVEGIKVSGSNRR